MTIGEKCTLCLATGCFSGNVPFMPGTIGSLWGLVFSFFLSRIDLWIAILSTVLFIFIAIWIAHKSEKIIKKKDPGCIVIDEISGMMVTLIGHSYGILTVCAGFVLFRIMDIVKPFPVRLIETHLPGGYGIVLDDIAAGFISNFVLHVVLVMAVFFG